MAGRSTLRNTSPQMQCDTLINKIEEDQTRIEIEILKHKNNKVDTDQLKQKHADMLERVNNAVDLFEKEYKDYPDCILDLMKAANKTIQKTKTLIDEVIKQ